MEVLELYNNLVSQVDNNSDVKQTIDKLSKVFILIVHKSFEVSDNKSQLIDMTKDTLNALVSNISKKLTEEEFKINE